MTKKKLKTVALCAALIGTVSIGGIMAYYTDADTATNEFVVGEIELDLQEPNWNPNSGIHMTPQKTIKKDPQILNDGINDEFVFLEVIVPCLTLVTANPDGTKNPAAPTELFTYTVNQGWTELASERKETENAVTHLYVYGTKDACTVLKKGVTTAPLFHTVTMANVVEDQGLEDSDPQIIVNAYGIQTADLDGGKTSAEEVWSILKEQAPTTTVEDAEDPMSDIKEQNQGKTEASDPLNDVAEQVE